jgi:hypothetical protein
MARLGLEIVYSADNAGGWKAPAVSRTRCRSSVPSRSGRVNGDIFTDFEFGLLLDGSRSWTAPRHLAHWLLVAQSEHNLEGDFACSTTMCASDVRHGLTSAPGRVSPRRCSPPVVRGRARDWHLYCVAAMDRGAVSGRTLRRLVDRCRYA